MAIIKPYTTQVSVEGGIPSRPASPADFGAGVGGAVTEFGGAAQNVGASLGEIEQRQEHSEILQGVARFRAEQTVRLAQEAANAQPGDPQFRESFLEQFDNAAAGLQDTARTGYGRRVLNDSLAELRSTMEAQAGTFQVHTAGVKAKQNYLATLGADQMTLFNDPSQFESVLRGTEAALADQQGAYAGIPPDAREELARKTKEDLALAAMRGTIRISPDQAQADWDSGKYAAFIPGDKAWMVTSEIAAAKTARTVNEARLAAAEEKARTEAAKKAESDYFAQLALDPTSVDVAKVATDPAFDTFPDMRRTLIELVRTGILARPGEIKTDSPTFIDLWDKIHLPDGNPYKIIDESQLNQYFGRGLTASDIETLRAEIQGKQTQAGDIESTLKNGVVNTAKSALTATNPLFGLRDPKGDLQLQRFMSWFLPEYKRQREAGKTPMQLLDPESPEYLGKGIERFTRSPMEMLRDTINRNELGGAAERPAAPEPIAGIKGLEWSPSRRQYRDPATGKTYDESGKPVAPTVYKNADAVAADYKAGKLAYDEAAKILRDNGWAQ